MRKVLAIAVLGLAISVSSGVVASAQRGGGGGGQGRGGFGQGRGGFGGGGGLQLLTNKDVQGELKMTEQQVAKVAEKQTEVRQKMQELGGFGGGGGGTPPSREEIQTMMAKRQEIQTKAVNDILDTKQQKRFKQLELQAAGAGALQRPDVAAELKITDEQKTKMREIQQAQMEEFRNGGFQFPGADATPEERQAFMKKMQDMQKASSEKVLKVLTEAQQKQFKEMQGEIVKFSLAPQFGGPGGGRRPGGAGGNPPPPAI